MVDHARAPALLDAAARGGDAAARLAGDDQDAHAALATAERPSARRAPRRDAARRSACSRRRWRRASRISDRRIGLDMPPPGCSARRSGEPASKADQKPRKGPNENGKKTRSPGPTRGGAVDGFPALEHPLPALAGVDPAQRLAGRGRRLAVARVVGERLAERRAPGRVRRLVGHEFALGGEGQGFEVPRKPQRLDPPAGALELARVEGIAPLELAEKGLEPLALQRAERLALERLLRGRLAATLTGAPSPARPPRPAPPPGARGSRAESARRASARPASAWRKRSSSGPSRSGCRRASAGTGS